MVNGKLYDNLIFIYFNIPCRTLWGFSDGPTDEVKFFQSAVGLILMHIVGGHIVGTMMHLA